MTSQKKEVRELHKYLTRAHATDIRKKNGLESFEASNGKNKFVDVQLARAIDILKGVRVYAKTTDSE